jgi:hemerythrin-like domain-containing protein
MLAQHVEARRLIELAATALEALRAETPRAAAELADALSAYERLLVHHIRYEEQVLYPFAERLLPLLRVDRIVGAFERRDEEQAAAVEAQLARLKELRRRYVE